jgi:CheY-like chemotaxis protein/putative methionine-R-sulfoxide reductase with GAF domain
MPGRSQVASLRPQPPVAVLVRSTPSGGPKSERQGGRVEDAHTSGASATQSFMAEDRPKLLIIRGGAGPGVAADAARSALSRQLGGVLGGSVGAGFDVIECDASTAESLLRAGGVAAVLVGDGSGASGGVGAGGEAVGSRGPLEPRWGGVGVLNALGEGVCLTDVEGRALWSNAEFAGYSSSVRARVAEVCARVVRAGATATGSTTTSADGAGPGGGGPVVAESGLELRRRFELGPEDQGPGSSAPVAGEGRYYEVMVSLLGAGDELAGARAIGVVRDISVLRRRQLKQAAIDRAGDELVRLDRETIRKLNTAERLRVLEQKVVRFAHELLHFDHFAIRLMAEKTGKLELVMAQGLPSEAMELELFARAEGQGISGYVAATGNSYVCPDVSRDPRYVMGINQARSSLTVPLRMNDRIIGIFNVESTQLNAFAEEDREFGEMFARWIALALHFLDLLVMERVTTGATVSGNVEGELSEPLTDIAEIAAKLKAALASAQGTGGEDAGSARLIERIILDVEAIKRRVKDVALGPATILGAEKAITDAAVDPVIVGKRILVADDDPRIRQVAQKVLRSRGAEVFVCEDGSTAMAALAQIGSGPGGGPAVTSGGPGQERPTDTGAGETRGFDLLVSDIRMPDKTGYEIFAAARKISPQMPVILMTGFGYDPHHSIVRASQEGLSCVLFKPFQAERLIEEVHKALAKRHGVS